MKKRLIPFIIFTLLWAIFSLWICIREQQYYWIILMIGLGSIPLLWEMFVARKLNTVASTEHKATIAHPHPGVSQPTERKQPAQIKSAEEYLATNDETVVSGISRVGKPGTYFAFLYGGLVLILMGGLTFESDEDTAYLMIGFGSLAVAVAMIFFLVLFYHVWKFIINESKNYGVVPLISSPGKAVGFCFIPFYNFYWIFKAFGGFPKSFNSLSRKVFKKRIMSENIGDTIPVLLLIGIIPYVGYVTSAITLFILYPIFINSAIKSCDKFRIKTGEIKSSSEIQNTETKTEDEITVAGEEPLPSEPEVATPKFIRKRQTPSGTYEVFIAESAESARNFLKKKTVSKSKYYIKVETPEGNWGVDIDGLYLERLVSFQTNIEMADCEGTITGMPAISGLQYAANGIADNFIVKIQCGKCGYKWDDGVQFKKPTTVRCPNCKSFNKVDSSSHISKTTGLLRFNV